MFVYHETPFKIFYIHVLTPCKLICIFRIGFQYARGLKNFEAEQPYQHAIYSIALCLFERAWSKTELLEALDGITKEKLEEFANELLSKMFIEALIHGNANKEVRLAEGLLSLTIHSLLVGLRDYKLSR